MSSVEEALFRKLLDRIEHLERVVSRQTMRINNMIREGKVLEVDYENGLAIVDANGVHSPPVPWLQNAGDIVDWDPPKAGQRITMFSPNGDIGRGFIVPGGYTEAVAQPYQQGAMFARVIGNTKLSGNASGYMIETGTHTIKANVVIQGNVTITGSSLTHNGKNVGSTHIHTGVIPGGGLSSVPA